MENSQNHTMIGVGYKCNHPHCHERRLSYYDLVLHVEKDHSDPRVLEKRIIRDVHGKILALPPQLIFLYFPNVIPRNQDLNCEVQDPILSSVQCTQSNQDDLVPPHALRTNIPNSSGYPSTLVLPNRAGLLNASNIAFSISSGSTLSVGPPLKQSLSTAPGIFSDPCVNAGGLPRLQTTCMPNFSLPRVASAPSPDSGRGSEASIDECSNSSPLMTISLTEKSIDGKDDSNDSWQFPEDYSVENIVKASRVMAGKLKEKTDKPYKCTVEGCDKNYKNPNGIRYHARNSHRIKKRYRCDCQKKYSSEDGLVAHRLRCSVQVSSGSARSNRSMEFCESAQPNPTSTPTLHKLLGTPSGQSGGLLSQNAPDSKS